MNAEVPTGSIRGARASSERRRRAGRAHRRHAQLVGAPGARGTHWGHGKEANGTHGGGVYVLFGIRKTG